MLRSTGFFRGIDCPFYKEYSDGKSDRNGCNRPYCHFRHSKQRRTSYGAVIDVKKQKEVHCKQKEQGYDPFNPEVERPEEEQQNGGSSGSADLSGVLELEMVNRAIEEVRSEVEREKRKLSRIGDQEYDPSSNSSLSTVGGAKRPLSTVSAVSPLDYNPTPRCSKYTLDSDSQGSRVSSLEYVPTSVKKPVPRTLPPQLPSPPPSPKYSTNTPSPKCKYILDNSKPSTDMEYDPLSNYSARIAGKNKRNVRTYAAKIEGSKTHKLSGLGRLSLDEEYVPTVKKPRQQIVDTQKYTLSDSDEETSGTEYRPTSLRRLHKRKGSSGSVEDAVGAGRKERMEGPQSGLTQRSKEESREQGEEAEDSESCDVSRQKHKPENKAAAKFSPGKSSKSDKLHKGEKESSKTSGSGGSKDSSSKDKGSVKKSSHDSVKKDGKSEGKKDDGKVKIKDKLVDKAKREGKEEKRSDGKVKTTEKEKVKSESGKREKEREKGGGESKKPKTSDKEKESIKHKNGQIDASRKEKDGKITKMSSISSGKDISSKISCNSKGSSNSTSSNSKSSSNSTSSNSKVSSNSASSNSKVSSNSASSNSKVSSSSSKDKLKKSISSSDGKMTVKDKNRSVSLSHADLFGDESPEEAEPMEEEEDDDDDDEEEEVLVRKSAALKRVSLSKRKALELTPSSSEDEADGRAGWDEIDSGGVDYSSLQMDLDLDSDPMEECLRIFNESKDVRKEDKGRQAKQPSRDSEEEEDTESTLTTLFPGQRKRVSHFSAKGSTEPAPKPVVHPYRRQTAQEICYKRMQIAQQQAAQLAAAVRTASASASPSSTSNPSFPGERKRVAHRPNPLASSSSSTSGPADYKPAAGRVVAPNKTLTAHLSIKAHTSAGILSKTSSTFAQRRVAHTPTMKSTSLKRPVIPTEFGAKVPTNIRQRYLTTFIDECVKFCPSEEVAFQMALDEESIVYERSSSKNIYLNVAVNTLTKLRSKNGPPSSPVTKAPAVVSNRKVLSHEELLGGRHAATTSFTINRMGKQQEVKPVGAGLYRKLRDYLMTEEQLQEHGYPRAHPEISGRAVIHNQPEKKISPDPFAKICCRCGAEYKINVNGNCVRKEECNHHWGRLRRQKVSGGWDTIYSCCSGAVGSPGCQVSKQHVQDGRKESVDGYVKTFSKNLPPDGNGGVYALDCEMCYTTQGLELTRVTVINADLKVIYDTFVRPESKVVDYNTRFSGVTEEDLESATITLRDVQAVLLSMFSAESILIGHSLESDLLALKLIHDTVVDTAIVFPHRLGLPYKRALRNLMAEHLKRIIQDNVDGHDSSEDASACMELMFWKIKEDAKVKR